MAAPKVQFKVKIADLFGDVKTNGATREAVGQAIIDRIVTRTSERKIDKFGRSLGQYSDAYKKSLGFKVMKGGQSEVNLTATGDMLGSLTILAHDDSEIVIGFDSEDQNAKAYGHVSGMEGHPTLEGKVKKRDFMGLPKGELNSIAGEFEDQVQTVDAIESAEDRESLDRAIRDTIRGIESGLETTDDAE